MIEQMQPGRYRTRDGRVAVIVSRDSGWMKWPWKGEIDGHEDYWGFRGEWRYTTEEQPKDLMELLPDAEPPQPVDDRIERALQVLREAQTWDWRDGGRDGGLVLQKVDDSGEWVRVEVLSELRKILEGGSDDD